MLTGNLIHIILHTKNKLHGNKRINNTNTEQIQNVSNLIQISLYTKNTIHVNKGINNTEYINNKSKALGSHSLIQIHLRP